MDDLISRLSELRCQYNCFDENERDAYHTLSEAIKVLSDVPDTNVGDMISRQTAIDAVRKLYILEPRVNNDYAYDMAIDQAEDALRELPSVDTDLSGFSDKLWKTAYERGKAEVQRWIPVSERLPDNEDEKVLVTDEYGDIDIAWFEFNEWIDDPKIEWWNGEYKVQPAAWMPLPEPYKGGQ